MIFARLRLGPTYNPTYTVVEIIDQCEDPPLGRFKVRDIKNKEIYYPFQDAVELLWWENYREPNPS